MAQEETPAASRPQGFAEKLELLKYYRAEDAREWTLINGRLAAYVTSQSFLMLSFSSAMNNGRGGFGGRYTLPMSLAIVALGLLTSYHAHLSIRAGADTLRLWRAKQRRLFFTEGDPSAGGEIHLRVDEALLPYDSGRAPLDAADAEATDIAHRRSLDFALVTPWLFGTAWVFLLGLTLFVHLAR